MKFITILIFSMVLITNPYLFSQNINEKLIKSCGGNSESILQKINLLIENGADVNYVGKKGRTPLTQACFANSSRVVELLIKNGADIHKRDEFTYLMTVKGALPIEATMFLGGDESLQVLLDHDAKLDLDSENGMRFYQLGLESAIKMKNYYKNEVRDSEKAMSHLKKELKLKDIKKRDDRLKLKALLNSDVNKELLDKIRGYSVDSLSKKDFLDFMDINSKYEFGKVGILGYEINQYVEKFQFGFLIVNKFDIDEALLSQLNYNYELIRKLNNSSEYSFNVTPAYVIGTLYFINGKAVRLDESNEWR